MKAVLAAVLALSATASAAGAATSGGYKVIDTIKGPDGGGWDYIRIDPATNRLMVTRTTSVETIDLGSGRVSAGLAAGKRLHDPLPVNGGKEVLVTHGGTNEVVFVDAHSWQPLATIPAGTNPDAAGLDPKTGLVIVMNHNSGDITVVDPKTHKAVGAIKVGGDLEQAAFDGKGRAFVNIEDKNEAAVVDVAARKVVARYKLPGCDGPTGAAYDPATHWLLASCDGGTAIVNADTGKPVAALKTGKAADGVAIDFKRRTAFVPGRDGTLAVISLAGTPKVTQVLHTAANNRTVAVDQNTGRVYLPAADFPPAKEDEKPLPLPGTFKIVVVGR
jgi:DNA-binding beta-propeller fold protein YncE